MDDLTSVPYVTRQQVVLDGKVYTVYTLRAMMGPGFPPHTSYNCFPHNPIVTHGCESNRFGIEQVLVTSRDLSGSRLLPLPRNHAPRREAAQRRLTHGLADNYKP